MKNTQVQLPHGHSQDTVRAGINEKRFFETLKHLFTSSTSVIGEIMQNGRRAGASRIVFSYDPDRKCLAVDDDGCGITDFNLLVQLAESGWDEQVTLTDKPFGMGLFSMFYAAQTVSFHSAGKRLSMNLDDIVNKRSKPVLDDAEDGAVQKGTRIVMDGLCDELTKGNWLVRAIEERALGFPIPVFFNGKECERPFAQESLVGVHTPIGFVSYRGVTTNDVEICRPQEYRMLALFLQGLPLTSGTERAPIVVHLDSTRFIARMPDRSHLFDHDEQLKLIQQELCDMARRRLVEHKSMMSREAFVQTHWDNCRAHNCMELFNDIPWLPNTYFERVDMVVKETDEVWQRGTNVDKALISRDQIVNGEVVVWSGAPQDTGDTPEAVSVLKIMQRLSICGTSFELPPNHWLHELTHDVSDLRISATPVMPKGEATFYGELGECQMRLVERVQVQVTSTTDPSYKVETSFTKGWFMIADGNVESDQMTCPGDWAYSCYITPIDDSPEQAIMALGDYRDENEVYREEWVDSALLEWNSKCIAMRGQNIATAIRMALNSVRVGFSKEHSQQGCLVQGRTDGGADVIDLSQQVFWVNVARELQSSANEVDINAGADLLRCAFEKVAQAGSPA